jgi:tetratricopeptide (TPR) repeat protein
LLLTLVALTMAMAMAAGGAVYLGYGRPHPPKANPRDALDRALRSGALAGLLRARELARVGIEGRTPDPDVLVRLALVNAFLTCDYAVDANRDAEEALRRADTIPRPSSERLSLAATARALLALAASDRALARSQAELALSVTGATPPPFALLVSARVRTLAGDPGGAASELDRALQLGPGSLPVVTDWAAARIDAGDAVSAAQALVPALGASPDNSLARLVLADAERALGEAEWTRRLDPACASDSRISRTVRTLCALESALRARLDGDRAGAVRKAKAIAQTTDDAVALGRLSLLLALLGEVDAAADLLQKAAKLADPSAVSLQWARLAILLGRGQSPEPSPLLDHPAGTERDLVAMRAAYARSSKQGLAAVLKGVPPGVLDIDLDARALALLGRASPPSKPELSALERRGERGNPVASYVLATLAFEEGDFRAAARRFAHSLALHGDACRSAALYLESLSHLGRGTVLDKAGLRALRARNAQCPLPDL